MPTETAATESVSAFAEPEAVERAPRRDVRAARSRRSGCRRRPGGRRSRARASARRAPRSRRPRGARGRSAAGSRPCARSCLPALASRCGALARRGGQQRVLGGQPAAPRAVQPARDAVLERRRAEHARLALRDRARSRAAARGSRARSSSGRSSSGRAGRRRGSCAAASSSATRPARPRRAAAAGSARPGHGSAPGRRSSGSGSSPSRRGSFSIPLRSSVSATSRAVSSAEKTSVTPRPKTRWKIGLISG